VTARAAPRVEEARKRAFLALSPDADAQARIASGVEELRRLVPEARFVRPEGIHLTLRFLGGVGEETLDLLSQDVARAAGECPPFEARLKGPQLFPNRGRARVLCLEMALPEPARSLQEACEQASRRVGLAPEERPLRPHLTLARFLKPPRGLALPSRDFGTTRIDAVFLYESHLRPGGSVYTPLRSFPLGAP